MSIPAVRSVPARAVGTDGTTSLRRTLPEETAVAFVYDGTTQAVMMATPADIRDFATGFSLTEGIVDEPAEILDYEEVAHPSGIEARMWLSDRSRTALADRRRFMAGPVGCGLCGIDRLDQAMRPLPVVHDTGLHLTVAEISQATEALRGHQPLHDLTRAVHAAGFLVPGSGIVLAREDVGRHNALDKLIGALARAGIDPAGGAIVLTSRVSVELVQKCALAGCPVMVAVSAPTARALRLAEDAGITLAALARAGGFEVFSHAHRVTAGNTDVA